jgi:hypothetical protein
MRQLQLVLGLVCAQMASFASPASATVVLVPPMDELARRSDVVVQAIVRESQVIKDEQGRIITVTSLEVLDGLRGRKTGDIVRVHQLGGEFGGQQAWVAGAHKFVINEEIVFFGVKLPKDESVVVPYGIGFGIFRVLDDVDGRHVHEIGGGDVSQLVRLPDGRTRMTPVTPRRFESLDAFKAMVRASLDGRDTPTLPTRVMQRPQRKAPMLPTPSAVKG